MQPGPYVLSKDRFSLSGDFTLADGAGTTVMTFDSKVRVAVRFDALDAEGRVRFTGQGSVFTTTDRFEFERDGQPHASMRAEWEGGLQRVGPQRGRYVVTCVPGDTLHTAGDMATAWTLCRGESEVARVERAGRTWPITLLDAADAPFVMTVVMAVVQLTLGHERTFGDG